MDPNDGGYTNAADTTNSLWSAAERWGDIVGGAGHAVAGAWDTMNGDLNGVLSSGLRAVGDDKDADMSDGFQIQRYESARSHFDAMHRDFDGSSAPATESLDIQGAADQNDWSAPTDDDQSAASGDNATSFSGDDPGNNEDPSASDTTLDAGVMDPITE